MGWKDLWPFTGLFGRPRHDQPTVSLYSAAVQAARREVFYTDFAVADSLDGRFDMVSLHVYLILRRLRDGGAESASLSQSLCDIMFDDMDENLRELGVGDMGVGKRVRRMAEAFYGRLKAYDAALAGAPGGLEAALLRNVYRCDSVDAAVVGRLAAYVTRQMSLLAGQSMPRLLAGDVMFADPLEPPVRP